MSNEEAIQMLENIRDYLCSGNPVWRTDVIRDAVNMAIVALNNDEPQTKYCGTCRFEDYSSSKEPCNSCLMGGSKWQPKDEPQTDCPWK